MPPKAVSMGRRAICMAGTVFLGLSVFAGAASAATNDKANSPNAQANSQGSTNGQSANAGGNPDRGSVTTTVSTATSSSATTSSTSTIGTSSGGNPDHTSSNPVNNSPQPPSNADFTGNGANTHGPYDSTRNGSPSLNGNGNGQAVGKPCAGCVGKADNKNPKGQMPGGSDHNAGYECDTNHGIGRTNPAHTGCTATTPGGGGGGNDGGGNNGGGSNNPPGSVVSGTSSTCTATTVGTLSGCVEVLGETLTATPGSTPAAVLGETLSATTPQGQLPLTGGDFVTLMLVAAGLICSGGALMKLARRTPAGEPVRATS